MAKFDELTVEVATKLTVSDETASEQQERQCENRISRGKTNNRRMGRQIWI